ncbi:hypothetical protein BD560DRAFT_129014, partial [Blakeslea trispora]
MSRLIVKNLPKELSEEKFREHFAKKGEVTDAKLMKTQWGTSRRFGFIGYKNEATAEAAIQYYNNTFINTSRISVEKAIAYGSERLPRAWSKYSEGSSAHDRMTGTTKKKQTEFAVEETDAFKDKQLKDQQKDEFVNKLNADKNDPKLKEYLDVMTSRSKSKTWANDESALEEQKKKEEADQSTTVNYADSDDDLYDELPANKQKQDEEMEEDQAVEAMEQDEPQPVSEQEQEEEEKKKEQKEDAKDKIQDTGRLFVRNLSYACTEQDLRDLFGQYGALSEVHMPIAKDTKKSKGYAYILYLMPEHAVSAYEDLDMKDFQGRLLHVLPANEKPPSKDEEILG